MIQFDDLGQLRVLDPKEFEKSEKLLELSKAYQQGIGISNSQQR